LLARLRKNHSTDFTEFGEQFIIIIIIIIIAEFVVRDLQNWPMAHYN